MGRRRNKTSIDARLGHSGDHKNEMAFNNSEKE